MEYHEALVAYGVEGAGKCSDAALMAGFCQNTIQHLVGAVSPKLVWQGAQRKGLTTKELVELCSTSRAVSDLQWS